MSKPEVFVSIDIESDGPAPGLNSMLALGAAAFDGETDQVLSTWYATLFPLPDARSSPETMAWWATQPDAWAEVNTGRQAPHLAVPDFAAWCEALPGRPVAVAPPIAFDFAFTSYYLWRFTGRNPLGFGGCDIKSYANGLAGRVNYRGLSEEQMLDLTGLPPQAAPLTHVAVDDATGQGRLFMALRRAAITRRPEPEKITITDTEQETGMTAAPEQKLTLPAAGLSAGQAADTLVQLGYPRALAMAAAGHAHRYPGGIPLPDGHVVHWVPGRSSFTVCARSGPDLLTVTCYGDDPDAVQAAALARARKLYGPDAPLAVEAVSTVHTYLISSRPGRTSYAEVRVRCLDLPEGFRS